MTVARLMKRLLAGLAGVALLLIVGVIILQVAFVIHQAGLVYPRPETKSIFLNTYSPKKTIEAFDLKQGGSSGGGEGSGAGNEFATHEKRFHFQFFINAQQRDALAKALAADVAEQLLRRLLLPSTPPMEAWLFDMSADIRRGKPWLSQLRPVAGIMPFRSNLRRTARKSRRA